MLFRSAGKGTDININSAIEWLNKAAKQDNPNAAYQLGNRCIHLKVDQFLHTITQSHKTFHAGLGGGVVVRAHHTAVFPVVHLPVYNGIGIVLHIGVGRNGGVNSFAFAQLRQQMCIRDSF